MQSFFAAVLIFLTSIFVGHHAVTVHVAPTPRLASNTSATAAVINAADPSLQTPAATAASAPPHQPLAVTQASASSPAQDPITRAPTDVLTDSLPAASYVTQDELAAQLQIATNNLRTLIYQNQSVPNSSIGTGGIINEIAGTNKIDQLTGTTLNNVVVNGISGITASNIPTNIVAANYLPLAGGTLTGAFADTATASSSFTGALGIGTTSPGSLLALNNLANFTSATSTFYSTGGLNLTGGGCFSIKGTCVGGTSSQWTTLGSNIYYKTGNIGVGTSTPYSALTVWGADTSVNTLPFQVVNSASTTLFAVTDSGNVGIGTTTAPSDVDTLSIYGGSSNPSAFDYEFASMSIGSVGSTAYGRIYYGSNQPDLFLSNNARFDIGAETSNRDDTSVNTSLLEMGQGGITLWTVPAGPNPITSNNADWSTLGDPYFRLGLSNAYLMNAKVGIGTTSPDSLLQVGTNSYSSVGNLMHIYGASNGSENGLTIDASVHAASNRLLDVGFMNGGTHQSQFYVDGNGNTIVSSGGYLGIGYANPNSALDVNGNVGIGTTSPDSLLQVGTNSYSSVGNLMHIYGASNGSENGLTIDASVHAASNRLLDVGFMNGGTHQSQFYVDGNGNTIVSSGGYLGIGTTSPDTLLSVGSATPSGNVAHFENSTGSCYINPTTTSLSCSSDARLKKNIADIDASSTLTGVLALDPVTYNWKSEATGTPPHTGFIAQQVLPIMPDLVSQGPDGYYTLNYAGFAPYIVKAIQQLCQQLTSLEVTVAGFADNFVSAHITVITGDFQQVNTQKLCETKSDGTAVCVTGDQLAAVLASANQSPASTQPGASSTSSPSAQNGAASTTPGTSPVIKIDGANPAVIHTGDAYVDLGATITGPQADLNLGIKTLLNGTLVSNIVLDTSSVATDTIDYVATDSAGVTSTSTRTVLIEPAALPPDASPSDATTSTAQ